MFAHIVFLLNVAAASSVCLKEIEPGLDMALFCANVFFALYGLVLIAKEKN